MIVRATPPGHLAEKEGDALKMFPKQKPYKRKEKLCGYDFR